jgi:hypothetical protein
MLTRGIEIRLRKLEAARLPPDAVFFLVWGRSDAEIEQAVNHAKEAGTISRGNVLVRAHWRGANGAPQSRWIAGARRELSPAEYDALLGQLDDLIGSMSAPSIPPNRPPPDERLSQMTDAELFAEALGEPVE